MLSRQEPRDESIYRSFRYDPEDPSPTRGGNMLLPPWEKRFWTIGLGPRDQREVESREDNLLFTTEPLDSPVLLEGVARAELFVSSDREDTDIAFRITDVYPDGRSMLVTDGIQRMRFRESPARAEFMSPGETYPVTVEAAVTAYEFQPGHRIRIILTGANNPRFEANPNTGRWKLLGPRSLVATNSIHMDRARPSALVLPGAR